MGGAEECSALCHPYCPVAILPTVIPLYPFDTCRPFCLWNGVMVASLTIPVISDECAHTHKGPLTALVIGVSSSVDLSVRQQERAQAAPKETIARLFPSEGMCRPLHSRITCLHTPISGIRHYKPVFYNTHTQFQVGGAEDTVIFRILTAVPGIYTRSYRSSVSPDLSGNQMAAPLYKSKLGRPKTRYKNQ